jgi:VanZ family protein
LKATQFHTNISLKWWAGLTAVVLLVILIVGLRPKVISPPNRAEWLSERAGIRFEKFGMAYTDSISDLIRPGLLPRDAFSIEFALKPHDFSEEGFHFILLFHGGQDSDQLMIGQWRSTLIVMNGNDYEHRRKTDRITVTSDTESPQTQFVTLTTGSEGTRIYIDGRLAAAKRDMRLELPKGKNVRLVAGNSAYGTHPWEGELYGIGIFGKTLSDSEVASHYAGWSKKSDFTFAAPLAPVILYNLDKSGMNQAQKAADNAHSLHVPQQMKPLLPSFMFQEWDFAKIGKSIFKNRDAFLNLFGFIPLGLLLGATLIKLGGRFKAHCVSIPLAAGFLVSLCIETLQAWMPARSSDMQDLFLNTAGALVGALLCRYAVLKGGGTETEPADK